TSSLLSLHDALPFLADLGFLPAVRRLLDRTPRNGQRMLFSATLDGAVNDLVRRYLSSPVTHEADSAQSPVSSMSHHVLHVTADAHHGVLLDLVASPGRKVVFTRTKHRAKKLARQLNSSGIPAVELHGNLSQNARTRTMGGFHAGAAHTLVASDIAARGIHVDEVGLVIHAAPPVEHKAYLHRSGRTARAGASGSVVTLMTDDQVRDVRDLTRKAGIRATTTKVDARHPMLSTIAPGERSFPGPYAPLATASTAGSTGGRRRQGGGSGGSGGSGRSGQSRSGQSRSAQNGSAQNGSGQNGSGQGRRRSSGDGSGSRTGGPSAGAPRSGRSGSQGRPARSGGAAAFSAGSR